MAELAPLAALWGLQPVAGAGDEHAFTPEGVQAMRRQEGLILGNGPKLHTSVGDWVQLPAVSEHSLHRLDALAAYLLREGYRRERTTKRLAVVLRAYYAARPLLPRRLQIRMRQAWSRGREERALLRWPMDGTYVSLAEAYLALHLLAKPGRSVAVRRRWPAGHVFAVTLTHDVEGMAGQGRCRAVAELERSVGVRSCFNFVAERYPVDLELMQELRASGFEIGLHGIKHDGKKFSSRTIFEQRLESMRHYRQAWNVVGFRSPATHRRWEWMGDLPFVYDSSYPDTDPYEPMPGGCASPWPFAIGPVLELPVTLPQDHTLWEIQRRPALPVWRTKLSWLQACGGLATLIVHPDYLTTEARWAEYRSFLCELQHRHGAWIALPREVASWWTAPREPRQEVTLAAHHDGHRLVFA